MDRVRMNGGRRETRVTNHRLIWQVWIDVATRLYERQLYPSLNERPRSRSADK